MTACSPATTSPTPANTCGRARRRSGATPRATSSRRSSSSTSTGSRPTTAIPTKWLTVNGERRLVFDYVAGTVTETGALRHVTARGQGIVLQQVGKVVRAIDFSDDLFTAGPHDLDVGNSTRSAAHSPERARRRGASAAAPRPGPPTCPRTGLVVDGDLVQLPGECAAAVADRGHEERPVVHPGPALDAVDVQPDRAAAPSSPPGGTSGPSPVAPRRPQRRRRPPTGGTGPRRSSGWAACRPGLPARASSSVMSFSQK